MHTHPLLVRRLLWFQRELEWGCVLTLTRSLFDLGLWGDQRGGDFFFFLLHIFLCTSRPPAVFRKKIKMKKFLQNKKGRYSFRQNKRGNRYPSKDFCKSLAGFVNCVNPAVLLCYRLWSITSLQLSQRTCIFCILPDLLVL